MRAHALSPLALLALCAGCALWPRFGPPPTVGPPYIRSAAEADSTTFARTAADSAADDLNQAMLGRLASGKTLYVGEEPARHPQAPKSHAARHASAEAADSIDSGADTLSAETPAVSVDLPNSARQQLEAKARSDIAWADSAAKIQATRQLAGHDRDKLETAIGLTQQAREAMERGDLPAAANLAYKARLLIEEVARR
jgi:DNA-binding XRE family transcriptional regulator